MAAMTGLRSVVTKCGCRSPTILVMSVLAVGVGFADRGQVAHVGAGTERPAAAGDDDGAHSRVGLGLVEQRIEPLREAATPSVHPLRPIQRQNRDAAVPELVEHRVVDTHRADLLSYGFRARCMHILYTYR